MSEIIIRTGGELASEPLLFHRAAAIVADSLSPTSRRVYDCTFRAWCEFADKQDFSIDNVAYVHVRAFIRLARKRRSLRNQVKKLAADLQAGRRPGDRLQGVGALVYKVRLWNPGTREGRCSGFRVAYLVREDRVILLAICQKPECADVGPASIRRILREISPSP